MPSIIANILCPSCALYLASHYVCKYNIGRCGVCSLCMSCVSAQLLWQCHSIPACCTDMMLSKLGTVKVPTGLKPNNNLVYSPWKYNCFTLVGSSVLSTWHSNGYAIEDYYIIFVNACKNCGFNKCTQGGMAAVCGLMLERKGMCTTLSLQACNMCYICHMKHDVAALPMYL